MVPYFGGESDRMIESFYYIGFIENFPVG